MHKVTVNRKLKKVTVNRILQKVTVNRKIHKVTVMQHIKDKYGINNSLASCHTAIIDGYIVEGHVPANDIKAMLLNKPEIKGLAVPGMVASTPGMEMGGKKAPFNVVAFDKDGQITLYKAYDQY
ncbi:hypothetical protein BMR04_05970 [Methylococcaceae bacterium HT3]|nr:hypothetical protein BMR04_05970 [Methylococcaceae bacterium HT3]